MQKTSFFPPFIRTLSVLFLGTLSALVLARGAMLGILWPEVAGNPASDILNALYIGTKFDIRMVVLGLIPIALILGIPPLERLLARSRGFRGLLVLLYAVVFAAATLVYIIDFGWFFYLHTRVDASLFELLGDPEISRARPIQKKCKRHLSSPRLSAPSASFFSVRCRRLCWREEPCSASSGRKWPETPLPTS